VGGIPTILNGILYELFNRANARPVQKCFWACIGMGILGLVLSANASWPSVADLKVIGYVLGFAFVGGFLYWLANVIAFENLPVNEAECACTRRNTMRAHRSIGLSW
jgi:hypothetical protein